MLRDLVRRVFGRRAAPGAGMPGSAIFDGEPLLVRDPEAFGHLVFDVEASQRPGALPTLADMLVCEAVRYGITRDHNILSSLMDLYRQVFLTAPVEQRREVLQHVLRIVPELFEEPAAALDAFIGFDTDPVIVSTATWAFVTTGSLVEGDPMTRPRIISGMIKDGLLVTPAAAFGGLLHLGDPRVCTLIRPLRDTFDRQQVRQLVECGSGFASVSLVEFYIDWLDDLIGRFDDDSLGMLVSIAVALARTVQRRSTPFIYDGERTFPESGPEDRDGLARITWEDFVPTVADRLYALEAKELPDRVMPVVLRAFDLPPRTPENEEAG